jgi:3-oxoacyl-ACP reductase-like protein
MSFQAYLDKVEAQTGLTPREIVEIARAQGFDETSKATVVRDWLKQQYGLGHGHAQAMTHVILKGPKISDKHVGKDGAHGDASDTLWLDGRATNPNP